MKTLEYPKTDYLLSASLESLHTESLEWNMEMDFLYDEITFFYKLLHKKELNDRFPSAEFAAVEKELIRINSEELDPLRTAIKKHESDLAAMLRSSSPTGEENYREEHKNLYVRVSDLNKLVRRFKKDVFSFVQKN